MKKARESEKKVKGRESARERALMYVYIMKGQNISKKLRRHSSDSERAAVFVCLPLSVNSRGRCTIASQLLATMKKNTSRSLLNFLIL